MAKPTTTRNRASLATARIIPPLLALIVAYASYVVVGPLSVNYLINERQLIAPGIAIPIVHFILLIPVAATWFRLLIVVWRSPGYVPIGTGFVRKDVFVCDSNGKPIWCDICDAHKPDRTHHNQDAGRCTRKMDHFCPWVGGVVGEKSWKFFIQFIFYTAIFTTFLTATFAYFVHKHRRVQWIIVLGLSAFFLLFTLGMLFNSVNLVFQNVTTIEHASTDRRTYLAVVLPPEMQRSEGSPPGSSSSEAETEPQFESELDDPSHRSYRPNLAPRRAAKPAKPSKIWKNTVTYPLQPSPEQAHRPEPGLAPDAQGETSQSSPESQSYAVLEVPYGLNPWDLGTPWRNFIAVFGNHLHEWLIPLKHSPCCDHSSLISEYPLGPQFESLLEKAGLTDVTVPTVSSSSGGRKKRRRLDEGWQNGERPDGWISQKEARRVRNQHRRQMREEHDLPGE